MFGMSDFASLNVSLAVLDATFRVFFSVLLGISYALDNVPTYPSGPNDSFKFCWSDLLMLIFSNGVPFVSFGSML